MEELHAIKQAAFPMAASVGATVVPAGIYLSLGFETSAQSG